MATTPEQLKVLEQRAAIAVRLAERCGPGVAIIAAAELHALQSALSSNDRTGNG